MYEENILRPPTNYPVYPPYHTGDYLEEYFYKFYLKNKIEFDSTGYRYIPIFWTNVYIENKHRHLIQPSLDSLPEGKYFTVSQHDDAVQERLPRQTLSFEAGGNGNGMPIPLICSPINQKTSFYEKDIFCSFVGSQSCSLRDRLFSHIYQDPDFYLSIQGWTNQVNEDRKFLFQDITQRSHFTLCPRGYGAQSFRLYETLQLNSIPVIVYDKNWFPYYDIIDWHSFCVLVHINEIHTLKSRLLAITPEQRKGMLQQGHDIYTQYFTLETTSKQILSILKNKN